MVAPGPFGPRTSDRSIANGAKAEALKVLKADAWLLTDWRQFGVFEKALVAYLRHSMLEAKHFFEKWHDKRPPFNLSSPDSPYRVFLTPTMDLDGIEAEYRALSLVLLQHITDLVSYDGRLTAGRDYEAQLESQCGITVFNYLRRKCNPAGDPAKQNELRDLFNAYRWDFTGTGDEIAIMLYESMAIWKLIDGNDEQRPYNFFSAMFANLADECQFNQQFALPYRNEHWRHETTDFHSFLEAIEVFGSQRYGGSKSVLALGGGGAAANGDMAGAPFARDWPAHPKHGRRCSTCIAWSCQAGDDPAFCVVLNDAFSLRYLVEKDSPLQLLHVLSQRIRLLEPGGADKVKAGNYVLHDDKDKCVALLAEADKRVILTIARDLPPCLQSACGMSAQEASLLADEFGVAEQAAPAILAVCDAVQEPGLCHGDSWGMSLDDAHALAAEFGDSNVPLICAPRGDGGEALVSLPLTTQRGSTDSLASAPVICMLPTAGFDTRAVVQAIILRARRALGGVRFALLGLTAACNEQARARTVRALRGILASVARTGIGEVAVGPVPSKIDGGEQRLIEVVAPSKIDGGEQRLIEVVAPFSNDNLVSVAPFVHSYATLGPFTSPITGPGIVPAAEPFDLALTRNVPFFAQSHRVAHVACSFDALRNFFHFCFSACFADSSQTRPTPLFVDNESAVRMANGLRFGSVFCI